MSRYFFVLFVLVLFCGCSTTPVKKQYVVPSKEYKNYITLKEEPEHRTFPQKLKDLFKKKEPEVTEATPVPKKRDRKIITPKRRLRQTNTNSVSLEPGTLMPMSLRPDKMSPTPKSNIMLYFIYIQAFIIAGLSGYTYFKIRSLKLNKQKIHRKLNL